MKRLYRHLVDGYDKGAALRQAKLDLLNQFGDKALNGNLQVSIPQHTFRFRKTTFRFDRESAQQVWRSRLAH